MLDLLSRCRHPLATTPAAYIFSFGVCCSTKQMQILMLNEEEILKWRENDYLPHHHRCHCIQYDRNQWLHWEILVHASWHVLCLERQSLPQTHVVLMALWEIRDINKYFSEEKWLALVKIYTLCMYYTCTRCLQMFVCVCACVSFAMTGLFLSG